MESQNNNFCENVKEWIAAYRVQKGVTDENIANELGISKTGFYNKLKKGSLRVNEAAQLAQMMHITFDALTRSPFELGAPKDEM